MASKLTQQSRITHQVFVIALGYMLFTGMVVGLVINTILPISYELSNPQIRTVNMTVFLVSLVLSALLPSIIAYMVGDTSTRSKNRQLHHYNGIMFGVLAYWIDVMMSQLNPGVGAFIGGGIPEPVAMVVRFMIPVLVTVLVVGALALYYHRSKGKQRTILEYKPFQVSLLVAIGVYYVFVPLQQLMSGFTDFVPTWLVGLGALGISYVCLLRVRGDVWQKVTLSVTAVTLMLITQYVVGQFTPGTYSVVDSIRSIPVITMYLASFMVWALYLYITKLSYRK